MKEIKYYVSGMHCASCELLIEKGLLGLAGVKSVEASTSKGEVLVEYEREKPKLEKLNRLFADHHYTFFDKSTTERDNPNNFLLILLILVLLVGGFLVLGRLGLGGLISVNSSSSLPAFFILGVIAGMSSCAALVGGLVLSMSKQWGKESNLLFNLGRIISFGFFGVILGLLGQKIGSTFVSLTPYLGIFIALVMIFLGLQMLGIEVLKRFQLTMPKSLTRYVANERNFKGKYTPILLGALTFFLPCGFTATAQGLAVLSGSPLRGAAIMLAFVLGTTPTLLLIGTTGNKFFGDHRWAKVFPRVAGTLVLFFAFYALNFQFNILGLPSFNDLVVGGARVTAQNKDDFPPLVGGKQVIKMNASARGYEPNYFKIRVGVPVRWEVTDTGTSDCTNAVISRSLFDGQIDLTPGQTSIKEFTPTAAGRYKFSCWMGMVSGTIEVVSQGGSSGSIVNAQETISSGASGCGCGGGK